VASAKACRSTYCAHLACTTFSISVCACVRLRLCLFCRSSCPPDNYFRPLFNLLERSLFFSAVFGRWLWDRVRQLESTEVLRTCFSSSRKERSTLRQMSRGRKCCTVGTSVMPTPQRQVATMASPERKSDLFLSLCAKITPELSSFPHLLFFSSFFTSHGLFVCTGTRKTTRIRVVVRILFTIGARRDAAFVPHTHYHLSLTVLVPTGTREEEARIKHPTKRTDTIVLNRGKPPTWTASRIFFFALKEKKKRVAASSVPTP